MSIEDAKKVLSSGLKREWKPELPLPNRKQERFVQLFVAHYPDWSQERCGAAAGYSKTSARSQSCRLLTYENIAQRIMFLREQADKISALDAVMGLAERKRVLSGIGRGLIIGKENHDGFGPNGAIGLDVTKFRPADALAAVKELNDLDGAYPAKRATVTVAEMLRGSNGIVFDIDLSAGRPSELPTKHTEDAKKGSGSI